MTLLFLPHNQSVPKGELQGRRCRDTQNVTPVVSGNLLGSCPEPHCPSSVPLGRGLTVYSVFLPCVWPHVSRHTLRWMGTRPGLPVGHAQEPVYSGRQPWRCLSPEKTPHGHLPRGVSCVLRQCGRLLNGRTALGRSSPRVGLPRSQKVGVKKRTSLEKQVHPLFRNGL